MCVALADGLEEETRGKVYICTHTRVRTHTHTRTHTCIHARLLLPWAWCLFPLAGSAENLAELQGHVSKVGAVKSKYIFQVQENTSQGKPREERRTDSFFLVITFKVRAQVHLLTLVMLTYPAGSQRPVTEVNPTPALEAHPQLAAVM